jgi:hypothetical protein
VNASVSDDVAKTVSWSVLSDGPDPPPQAASTSVARMATVIARRHECIDED